MTTRKNQLRSLFGTPATVVAPVESPIPTSQADSPQKRTSSAAVKAMGLSLGALSQEAETARQLRDTLATGEQVVELDPNLIERSPYVDRLSEGATNDEDFVTLKRSLAEHGQQVPVLVRPHADAAKAAKGLYQVAYGHRRVQAARALGKPVRAVVRALDDTALVIAQGKENAERRALSFIERAFFARTLVAGGFDRATAQAALSVHKSEMSRLLQVAEAIPREIAQAVGPAPKAGRPRWIALGELLARDSRDLAKEELASAAFQQADSDTRFQLLYNRLSEAVRDKGRSSANGAISVRSADGQTIADIVQDARAAKITIPISTGAGFADFLADQLPTLHARFLTERGEGNAK